MSTIDYKALAERVAQRAIYADNNADPNNKAWAADLRAVVSLLNGMADAQPVAWRCEVRGDGTDPQLGAGDWRHYHTTTSKREAQAFVARCGNGIEGRAVPLYPHAAAPQPEPKRPAFLDEIDRAKEHVASWPQWMKDATVSAAATLPVTEPKRELLSDEQIERLLAERDELRRQLDEARAEREAMANVLPGVYYMDPPDGGDVSLLKQLQRMSNDAARYRLLRRKFAIISDGEGNAEFCPINLPRPTYIAPNTAIELDTALDRERLGLDGTRPPTPVGWSDTDWIKHLQEQAEQPHPLAGQHINQGSMDAAADAYEAEYYDALKRDAQRYRWLRNEASTARKCDPMVCIYPLDEQDLIDGDRLDVAIDAAMDLTRPAEEA